MLAKVTLALAKTRRLSGSPCCPRRRRRPAWRAASGPCSAPGHAVSRGPRPRPGRFRGEPQPLHPPRPRGGLGPGIDGEAGSLDEGEKLALVGIARAQPRDACSWWGPASRAPAAPSLSPARWRTWAPTPPSSSPALLQGADDIRGAGPSFGGGKRPRPSRSCSIRSRPSQGVRLGRHARALSAHPRGRDQGIERGRGPPRAASRGHPAELRGQRLGPHVLSRPLRGRFGRDSGRRLCAPGVVAALSRARRRATHGRAGDLQRALMPLAVAVTAGRRVAGLKAAMDAAGFHGGHVRAPLRAGGRSGWLRPLSTISERPSRRTLRHSPFTPAPRAIRSASSPSCPRASETPP